ncbi:MAG: hypothetical protein QOD42_1684 [Sphingomonadales bacterium]|jgi:hypothetical protein|nr:hypothetical protein [Sphingomonadales bacterium]
MSRPGGCRPPACLLIQPLWTKKHFPTRFLYVLSCRMTGRAFTDAPASASSAVQFTPVRLRCRRDGWTPARQTAFILALRACRCVLEACRRVGLSSQSAYRLYRRPDAQSFRKAWDGVFKGGRTPSPSAAPSTSTPAAPAPPPRSPWTAIALWPVPGAALPQPSSMSSTSPASPPSGAGDTETDGMCHPRQLHHLPPASRRARPAYTPEGFIRAASRGSRR